MSISFFLHMPFYEHINDWLKLCGRLKLPR